MSDVACFGVVCVRPLMLIMHVELIHQMQNRHVELAIVQLAGMRLRSTLTRDSLTPHAHDCLCMLKCEIL